MKDTLLNIHGRKTYAMAWVVELGLFALAIGIAILNIKSVFETGGTIFNAILLGVGWVIIGVVELSTIPLAGALRIARWRDKWLAIVGVIGMTFLSAWTVYEFNEFASYNMTMPARKVLIKVENKENEISTLNNQNAKMSEDNRSVNEKLKSLRKEKKSQVDGNLIRRESQLNLITSEKNAALEDLNAQINELKNKGLLTATQNEKIDENKSEIERLKSEMDSKIANVNEKAKNAKIDRFTSARLSKETLNQQMSQINQRISDLNKQKLDEVNSIKKGAFMKSKVALKNEIRANYDKQIKEQEGYLVSIRKQIAEENVAFDTSEFDQELVVIKTEYESEMESLRNDNKDIREHARKQSVSLVEKVNNEIDALNTKKEAISLKYALLLQETKDQSKQSLNLINGGYDQKISDYTEVIKTDAEVQNQIGENNEKILVLKNDVISLVKDIELQMEPILYYRMAKWFHSGDGLPSKEAYLKAQTYIFAPMGLFFGLVSIALAYIGTGLKRDAELPEDLEVNDRSQKRKIKTMTKRLSKLDDKLEKERMDKIEWKQDHLNRIEKALELKNKQTIENKNQLISKLQFELDKSIENVVNMKKQLSNTVSSIPQRIVVKDDMQGLVDYKLFDRVDFSTEEMAQSNNYQAVSA